MPSSTHQESPIERFNVGPDPEHPGFSEMHPADEGHWVRYADHRALAERLVAALEEIHGETQEVAHEVEDPLSACETIRLAAEKALAKARRANV